MAAKGRDKRDDVKVVIFEPGGGPVDKRANHSSNVPKMTAGRTVLVGLMDRYLLGLLDPFVTLLEVHKLMYFMQATGGAVEVEVRQGPLRAVCRKPSTCDE
jgi:hypothetical protein